MIYAIMIFILWTWDLTPTWVNIVCTVLCGFALLSEGEGKVKNDM